jgi:hypothetical protein
MPISVKPAEEVTAELEAAADVIDTAKVHFQDVVDAAEGKNTSLYEQRETLMAQLKTIQGQLRDLNAQIAEAEGIDVKKARAVIRFLDQVKLAKNDRLLGSVI